MFENIINFFKKLHKNEKVNSKDTAKERLHLVLAQDRANISADFLEMMKQEIIEVIKKYIEVDEKAIDVRLTNKTSEDGIVGAPSLYANIPIVTIKNEARKMKDEDNNNKKEECEETKLDTVEKEKNEQHEKQEVINEEELQQNENKDENIENNEEDNMEDKQEENEKEEVIEEIVPEDAQEKNDVGEGKNE